MVLVRHVPVQVPLMNLYLLLEVYGYVHLLLRQVKDPENVVVQFQRSVDAQVAAQQLRQCPFFGSVLQPKLFLGYKDDWPSFNWSVSLPTDASVRAAFFLPSAPHRFALSWDHVPLNYLKPCPNLFLSHLLPAVKDEEVVKEFEKEGFRVRDMQRRTPEAVIIALENTEAAVGALVAMHGKIFLGSRVTATFSTCPPNVHPSIKPSEKADREGSGERTEEKPERNAEKTDDAETSEGSKPEEKTA